MIKSILRDFTRLANFGGREGRSEFWAYAVACFAIGFAVSAVIVMPVMAASFARMDRFAAEHPDQARVVASPGRYEVQIEGWHPELMPDVNAIVAGGGGFAGLAIVLLAAAVVRRLHDCGRSGLWGLLPLPFLGTALVLFPRLWASFTGGGEPDLRLFFALFANNALYLGALGLLGVLLAGQGQAGNNRFGPPAR
jgi:uncharacterized membrane protein YhaH (DUF805 family)